MYDDAIVVAGHLITGEDRDAAGCGAPCSVEPVTPRIAHTPHASWVVECARSVPAARPASA